MWQDQHYQEVEGRIKEGIERVVPHITLHQIYLLHLTRYKFAASFLRGRNNVLDIGCGSGYGSFLLAQETQEVTGIDYSQKAIDFAKEHFQRDNLTFQKMHWKQLANLGRTFDGIAALEFLEHIDSQQEFLQLASGLLKKDGIFILSTPHKNFSLGNNPFHVKELDPCEFKKLLGEYFNSLRLYAQFLKPECARRKKELQVLQRYLKNSLYYSLCGVISNFVWQPILRLTRVKLTEKIREAVSLKNRKEQIFLSDIRSLEELINIQAEDILFTSSERDIQSGDFLVAVCKREVV